MIISRVGSTIRCWVHMGGGRCGGPQDGSLDKVYLETVVHNLFLLEFGCITVLVMWDIKQVWMVINFRVFPTVPRKGQRHEHCYSWCLLCRDLSPEEPDKVLRYMSRKESSTEKGEVHPDDCVWWPNQSKHNKTWPESPLLQVSKSSQACTLFLSQGF